MGQKFILCAYEQRFFLCFTLCQMLIPSQTGIEKNSFSKICTSHCRTPSLRHPGKGFRQAAFPNTWHERTPPLRPALFWGCSLLQSSQYSVERKFSSERVQLEYIRMSLQNRPSPSPYLKQLCHWEWDPSPTECHGQLGLPTPAHSFRSPLDLKKKKGYPCFTFSALRKLSPDLCKKRLKCLKVV